MSRPVTLLLSSAAGHRGVHPLPAVLRLHRPDGAVLLAADGHHRLLRRLHVHPENLRRSQDRLSLLLRRSSSSSFFLMVTFCFCFFMYIFFYSSCPTSTDLRVSRECDGGEGGGAF